MWKSKRGSFEDIPFIFITLTLLGVTVLIVAYILSQINTQIQTSPFPTESKSLSTKVNNTYSSTWDGMFLVVAVLLALGSVILAALVPVHIVFLPLYLISMIFLVFCSAAASNVYQEIAARQFAPTASTLTFIPLVLNGLPVLVAVFSIMIMVAMFKKTKGL